MKNRKLFIILIVLVILVGGIYLLTKKNQTLINQNNKLQVTASFYPLYYFSQQIGGNKASVINITPAGAEPHDYDPSTGDIARIESSNMLVLNGAVESWGNKIKNILNGQNTLVITAGDGLLTKTLNEDGVVGKDPHVWLDPILAKKEMANIAAGFVKIDPKNKNYYENNEKQLDQQLDKLNEDFKNGLRNCDQKNIITSHAAFAYLGERYGLNQVAIAGLSPDAEPSSKQLADIADFAKRNNIKYIFFESLVSPKLSQTIANEVGAKTLVLDPIEGIDDNDIKAGKNYFTLMYQNLKNLQIALKCQI